MTYVRTRAGLVYAAFVTDVFSRTIEGWALYDSMRTETLPLQALNQAIVSAKETTRSGGDSDDNALAENMNGSSKNELMYSRTW